MNLALTIVADHREVRSKIPEILEEKGANVEYVTLKTGDYIVNNEIVFERKSKDDFVLSIIQQRLFSQCARMKKTDMLPILLIEGNPYRSSHAISREAIKGALLSVAVSWQIPIVYSKDNYDSANILLMAGTQRVSNKYNYLFRGAKPKRLASKQIFFLQGLPLVGPATAKALIKKFSTLEKIILASEDELREVDGIGKTKAKMIRQFIISNEFPND